MAIIDVHCKLRNIPVRVSAKKLEKRLKTRAMDDTIVVYTNLECLDDCNETTCKQRGGQNSYLANPNT